MTISEHATAEVRKQQEYEDYLSESKPVLELKGSTKAERIREVFEEALLLLEPIADELMKSLNSDEKFKLYGLYKHIRNGPCNDVAPSIWNVEKYFKHQAYNGNRDKRVEDAMTEYVQSLLSMTESRPSMKDFFLKCQAMVRQCDKDIATEPSDTFDDACRHAISVNKPPPQSMLTATFASLSKGVSNTIINLTGVVPLIPRGQLDISYRDLLFGAVQCVRTDETHTRVYEQKIERQWIDATTRDARVVTGLAVRSLFDLYFRVQKYPPGSEIIMSPPINVPAMVHVMKHHHIKIVGVDIPGNAESKGQIVSVDVDAIEKAMTSKTVAIMVVHPFGIISASDDDMQRIRKIADSSNSKVHVIEDSSEAYSGLSTSYAYMGSPHADVCFYSFGLIKAASALGGGIALIRNAATNDDSDSTIPRNMELFESMERFHTLHYQMQTNSEFIKKILKALFLRALADAPLLYGLLCACYGFMFGPDAFENLVTSLIRGYFNYKNANNTNKSKGKIEEETGPDMLLIRKRPSPPLLALMNRRFAQRNVSSHIEKKVARCNKLTKAILNSTNTDLRIPVPSQNLNHYYWIYPILCTDRKATCKAILKAGFDATHGATQLCCIPGVDQSSYPNARAMMDQTVYLPIAGPLFPDELTDKITKATLHETEQKPKSKLSLQRPAFFAPAFVIAIVATLIGLSRTSFVGFLHMVAVAGGMSTIILIGWSWFCNNVFGPFYLNTSCVFAKRNKMLLRDWPSNCEERKKLTEKKLPIISSLEVLRICETLPSGRDRAVFLTGGTGYIGSKILHDLLLFREQIGFSVVIVLCREHRNVSARDRIFKILDEDMFSFLSADEKSQYVRVINGDVTVENAGINSTDLHVLCNKYIVSHVIHSAASVSFNQSFPDAAKSNITSTLSLQKLATKLNHGQKLGRTKFVHISTAFIHGRMTGTVEEPLDETLFDLGNFDAQEIYKSMVGTQYYASRAYNELGFPNTYTFSKCVCEHLIATYKDTMQTIIIRPSIVGPAIESPYEGWAGRSPSTVVAAAALQMSVPWNLWSCGPTNATVVPVDIVSRFVLAKAFCRPGDDDSAKSEESSDDDYDKLSKDSTYSDKDSLSSPEDQAFQDIRFYHATWNVHSPESSKFCYRDMAIAVFHVCMVLRTMSRLSIIICLYSAASVMPTLQLSQETFDNLHNITCMLPVAMVGRILSFLGIDAPMLKKCQNFINLPTLFYFFMTNDFYFKSSLTAPATFSGEDYMLSCVLAASKFVEQAKEKKKSIDPSQKPSNITRYQVAGPWANEDRSIFWALSQPRGSFIVRFAGWVLSKVFYSCCSEVTIDLLSFSQVAEVTKAKGGPRVILAPTHRSYFDFLLVSYVFFCVPEIQMEIPFIVAADDFEHLPFLGTMARLLRAIFVSRKKTNVDPKLKEKLNNIEKRANGSGFSVEVFIEGTRSRDRRFVKPKTGVLKCLQQNGGGSTVVPIAISYERLPEQSILCSEADGEVGKGMSVHGLMCWLCVSFIIF
jgi:1-acyl-sn-glycerol-3-phosphate acyltransferase